MLNLIQKDKILGKHVYFNIIFTQNLEFSYAETSAASALWTISCLLIWGQTGPNICICRLANPLPSWLLCLSCGEEMVGAILQATMATGQILLRFISRAWREEVGGEDGQKEAHPVLPSVIQYTSSASASCQ
jgi:hypothetical protein